MIKTFVFLEFQLLNIKFQVARSGRFGAKGLAITYVGNEINENGERDKTTLNKIEKHFDVQITAMLDVIDPATYSKDLIYI